MRIKSKAVRFAFLFMAAFGLFSQGSTDPVKSAHPRIFITPELMTALQARKQANTPEWQRLKSRLNSYLSTTVDAGYQASYWGDAVSNSSLIYLMLQNSNPDTAAMAAQQCLKYMHALVYDQQTIGDGLTWKATIRRDRGYGIRNLGINLALAYDWLHDHAGFTAAFKDSVRNVLFGSIAIFEDPNDPSYMIEKFSPQGNYFIAYWLTVALTGYATQGDDSRAAEAIAKARALFENYVLPSYQGETASLTGSPYAVRKSYSWNTWNMPTVELGPPSLKGGHYLEGTEYDNVAYASVLMYPLAVLSATGENVLSAFPWCKSLIYSRMHSIQPSLTGEYPGTRDGDSRVKDLEEQLLAAYLYRDSIDGGYAQYILKNARSETFSYNNTPCTRFLFYNSGLMEHSPADLPLSYLVEGPGLGLMRSGWDTMATWAAFQGGFEPGTNYNFIGKFEVSSRGKPLLISAPDNMPCTSDRFNTITIDDHGDYNNSYSSHPGIQSVHGTNCVLEAWGDGGAYVYAKGNIKDAYRFSDSDTNRNPLTNYRRQFVYLRPDCFVAFDRISTKKAQYSKKFLLHLPVKPQLDGSGGFTVTVNNARLCGKVVLPAANTIDTAYEPNSNAKDWRLGIAPATNQTDDNYLIAFSASNASSTIPACNRAEGKVLTGVQFGSWAVFFNSIEGKVTGGTYTIKITGDTIRHLIADAVKDTVYWVSSAASGADSVSFAVFRFDSAGRYRVISTHHGVLSFQSLGTSFVNLPASTERGLAREGHGALLKIIPNRINPQILIQYAVRNAETRVPVLLSIFNAMGQCVTTLVNSPQSEGRYTVIWNAGNRNAGVYLARLSTGGRIFTERITWVR